MDYKELAEKAREIDAKATPGPWMWDLRECNHQCLLTTTHSGKYYVMGFQRWGLQDALPSFQVYDRYEGQMKDRGSHGMVRADKLSKSYPGQEHHHGFDNFIDHPDARYIAESRELFHQMATAITELLARAHRRPCSALWLSIRSGLKRRSNASRSWTRQWNGLSTRRALGKERTIMRWRGRERRSEKQKKKDRKQLYAEMGGKRRRKSWRRR